MEKLGEYIPIKDVRVSSSSEYFFFYSQILNE